jgi:aryl-alcohol dehydrogenase-like predicted oxidoreductase
LLRFAEQHGWALPQLAIGWLLSRPQVATVIAGADRPEHVADNARALEVSLTAEDLAEIDRLTLVDEDRTRAPVFRVTRGGRPPSETAASAQSHFRK